MIREDSPKPTKRQRRRIARTAELLDHAQRILATEGRDALTIGRLAKEADAAVGALYRYFDGKSALLAALQVRGVKAYDAILETAIAETEAGLARVRAVIDSWDTFRLQHPELHALLDEGLSTPTPLLDDESARTVDQVLDGTFSRAEAVYDEAVELGALAPGNARHRTRATLAALHGVDHLRKRDRLLPDDIQAAVIRDHLVTSLLKGWGADL